jgi:hypothetical protein
LTRWQRVRIYLAGYVLHSCSPHSSWSCFFGPP